MKPQRNSFFIPASDFMYSSVAPFIIIGHLLFGQTNNENLGSYYVDIEYILGTNGLDASTGVEVMMSMS